MVSMKDIAQRCGVSVATVSKALNGRHDISEETRVYITEVADEMGYLTNSAARALKTNRTYNIGVLFVDEQDSGLTHEYFSAVLDSLKVEAEANGYDITFINRNVGGKNTSYLKHCQYRSVDGLVMACVDFSEPQVQELIASNIPVVTIDHIFNNRIAVVSDNVNGMETLTDYILEKGHRRVAFVHGESTSVTSNRLIGFHRACEKHGVAVREDYIREAEYHNPELCEQITRELLEVDQRPTCICFPDDYSLIGGLNAIREKGLRIPEDISVAGYDGIKLASILTPRITTYRQDTEALGKMAASRLINLIERPKTALLDRVMVPGVLVEGESVAEWKE